MKKTIAPFLFIISLGCFGQKKGFVWPKTIRDSQWTEYSRDTVYGTIEWMLDGGKIISDGFIVKTIRWSMSKPIYSKRGQQIIDSIYKNDNTTWLTLSIGGGGIGDEYTRGFAILNGRIESVYNYTFTVKNKK